MNKYHKRSILSLSIFVAPAMLSAANIAVAEEARFMLEEVIVTAQKKQESLQDVPISMSAISGEKITAAGINNMQALSSHVPGLQIGSGAVNDNIFIRGIGSGTNKTFEQSVGMYIDGIYMGRSHQYRSPFLDVERVEVLRGPQGVLFGKNTVAGVINITTASPDPGDVTYGSISAEYEPEADTQVYSAMVSTSLSDTLAARVAGKYRESDGWIDNALLGTTEPSDEESSVRLTLAWTPTDDISTTLKVSHAEIESYGNPIVFSSYAPVSSNPTELAAVSSLAPVAFAVTSAAFPGIFNTVGKDFTGYKENTTVNKEPGLDLETDGIVLNVEWLIGDYTLTSVTGYSAYEFLQGLDADLGPLDFIGSDNEQEFDQLSQEFRLTAETDGPIEWTAGVYFEQQTLKNDSDLKINSSFGQPAIVNAAVGQTSLFRFLTGGAYDVATVLRHGSFEQETETASVFAQATWTITDTLRATLGLRYAQDKKEIDKSLTLTDDILGFGRENADADGYALQPFLDAMWGAFGTERHNFNGVNRETENLTPALNVEWDVAEDAMIYFSYSEGYKSGGFNGADDMQTIDSDGDGVGDTPNTDFEFEDEEVITYELGGKFTLAERTMRLNWAIFHTQYSNLQVTSFNGTSYTVGNAAETTIEGFEADWEWQASEGLHVGANVAYLDYAYDNYDTAACNVDDQLQFVLANPGASAGNCTSDLSGETGTFAPEWSGALSADYYRPISDALALKLGIDANFKDEYYADDDLNKDSLQDATWKINLRAGLQSMDETWEVMLYGNNLTDEQTLTSSLDTPLQPGAHSGFVDEGRVWGLRGSYDF
jgi:iron complex outermembrane recepter protein